MQVHKYELVMYKCYTFRVHWNLNSKIGDAYFCKYGKYLETITSYTIDDEAIETFLPFYKTNLQILKQMYSTNSLIQIKKFIW